MDRAWLNETVAVMRQIGRDTQSCEVKEAKGELPSTMADTLSAFSNGSGGHVILGLSEKNGFTPVPDFNAARMSDAFGAACEKLTPVVRPDIAILPFEGARLVCAEVPEMHPKDKPCYVTSKNRYGGSFIRTGDGDRRLTPYEVDRLLENHGQPLHDDEPVPEASVDDLDAALLNGFLARQRELHPRILGGRSDEDIMLDLHVVRRSPDGALCPTLAGVMALGAFPQKFFPRLNVTFTSFPGTTKAERVDERRRFLDSQTIIGPIPMMVDDVLAAVTRNMRTGAVIRGTFRQDVPDYPRTAVREAVANALMHRDYSPDARGSQVQVNMYADRLEILNPGGLYGDVTVETLGESGMSSTRNQYLSNILETTPYPDGGYVVENRGTGYQEIEEQLKKAMMLPPQPRDSLTSFCLTFEKRRLDSSETGVGRPESIDEAIKNALSERMSASTKELAEASGLSRSAITSHIKSLVALGVVEPMEPARSPKQRYRLKRSE